MTAPTTTYGDEIRALIAQHGLYADPVEARIGELVTQLLNDLGDHPEAVAAKLEALGYTEHSDDSDELPRQNPVAAYLVDRLQPADITTIGGVWITYWTREMNVDSEDTDWHEIPAPVRDFLSDIEEEVLGAEIAAADKIRAQQAAGRTGAAEQ
jgi:hypothetical protein